MNARRRRGFSILELLISLVLIGFLVTLADFGLPLATRGTDESAQREAFVRELQMHRAQALATGRKQVWYFPQGERFIEFAALPDGRVISSEAGTVDVYSGDLILP